MMLRLLGTIEAGATSDSTKVVTAPRLRLILSFLGAHAGQRVSVDRLIDALWPDDPPKSAEASIQVHISKIRRIFEPDLAPRAESHYLKHQPGAYVLDLPREQVDVTAFADIEAGVNDSDDPHAARVAALDMWTDPPFAEYAAEPWAIGAATELRRVQVSLAQGHYEHMISHGLAAEVVDDLRADVMAHPFDEQLAGLLMRALYQLGDQQSSLDAGAQLRARLLDELGLDPTPEFRALEQQILTHDDALQAATARPRSDRQASLGDRTPLFGRDEDVDRVRSALDDHRLVTLTGPGGVGKTRLARAIADGTDGAVFIDLSTATTSDEALTHIEDALSVDGDPLTERLPTLASATSTRATVLVLDNCEQLTDDFAQDVDALVRAGSCPLLITSQRSLGVTTEHLVRVEPFGTPGAALDGLQRHPGIRLLTRDGRIELNELNAAALVELHNRLDGLPLALELAAFRLRTVSIDEILDTPIDAGFAAPADLPERHRSLDNLVSSSIAALDALEQEVLDACSIFAGSVPLSAIVELMADKAEPVDVGIALAALVDRSLVSMSTNGPVRYRMLEMIRHHCRQRMDASGRTAELKRRHARLIRRAATDKVTLTDPTARFDSLGEDVLAALDRVERAPGDAARDINLVTSVAMAWYGMGRIAEARDRLRRVLRVHRDADPLPIGNASALLGMVSFDHGAFNELAQFTGDALRILEPLGAHNLDFIRAGHHFGLGELDQTRIAITTCLEDPWTVDRMRLAALEIAATSAWFLGDHEACADHYAEQEEVALELGDSSFASHALRGRAMMAAILGSPEAGLDLSRRADQFAVTDFSRPATARHTAATVIRYSMGDLATAGTEAGIVLERSIHRFDAHAVALAVPIAAACALDGGDCDSVARLTGWFDGLCAATGFYAPASSRELLDHTVETARSSMEPNDWVIARADGAAFGLAAALPA